jgi:hypothetical protein
MIAMFATLVFAAAGCAGIAVIGASIRNALPQLRMLSAQQRALAIDPLALDRVYLVSLIETPRHDGTLAPVPAITVAEAPVIPKVFAKRVAKGQARHGACTDTRRFTAARFHAAA